MKYYISDLHLGHKNLVENLREMTVEEHDEKIISLWNKKIQKEDTVHTLGNIIMGKYLILKKYTKRNGE